MNQGTHMKRWRHGEKVGISLVAVRFVEVEGIASEDEFADCRRAAADLVGVVLCLAAIEDRRWNDMSVSYACWADRVHIDLTVECVSDVVKHLRVRCDGW
jgi:hypothetical protein